MITLGTLGKVWGIILSKGEITLEELENELKNRGEENIAKELKDILLILYSLYLIDYVEDKIVVASILSDDILDMPCLRCDKVRVCRIGAKNNPFRCEEFVKWFVKHMTE